MEDNQICEGESLGEAAGQNNTADTPGCGLAGRAEYAEIIDRAIDLLQESSVGIREAHDPEVWHLSQLVRERRFIRLNVTAEFVHNWMLKPGAGLCPPLPDDAIVVGLALQSYIGGYVITVASCEFGSVWDGCYPPSHDLYEAAVMPTPSMIATAEKVARMLDLWRKTVLSIKDGPAEYVLVRRHWKTRSLRAAEDLLSNKARMANADATSVATGSEVGDGA